MGKRMTKRLAAILSITLCLMLAFSNVSFAVESAPDTTQVETVSDTNTEQKTAQEGEKADDKQDEKQEKQDEKKEEKKEEQSTETKKNSESKDIEQDDKTAQTQAPTDKKDDTKKPTENQDEKEEEKVKYKTFAEMQQAPWFKNNINLYQFNGRWYDGIENIVGRRYLGEPIADILEMSETVEGFDFPTFFEFTVFKKYGKVDLEGFAAAGYTRMDSFINVPASSMTPSIKKNSILKAPVLRSVDDLQVGHRQGGYITVRYSEMYRNRYNPGLISALRGTTVNGHYFDQLYTTLFNVSVSGLNGDFSIFNGDYNISSALLNGDISTYIRCTEPHKAIPPAGSVSGASYVVVEKGSNYAVVEVQYTGFGGNYQTIGGRLKVYFTPKPTTWLVGFRLIKIDQFGGRLNGVKYKVYADVNRNEELTMFYRDGLPYLQTEHTNYYGYEEDGVLRSKDIDIDENMKNKLSNGIYLEEIEAPECVEKAQGVFWMPLKLNEVTWYMYDANGGHPNTNALTRNVVSFPDPMRVVLRKQNSETGNNTPSGGAKLSGAEFEVKYYDVTVDDVTGLTPMYTWTITTNEVGNAVIPTEQLPYIEINGEKLYGLQPGTITVQETKAPEGYYLNDTIYLEHVLGDHDKQVSTFNAPIVPEQVFRGDFEFTKVNKRGDKLANVEFKITSKTTGEEVKVMTDENGYFSTASSFKKHTEPGGVWFGGGTPDDNKGALPYDTYIVEELRCAGNVNYKLVEPFEVTIENDGELVKVGNIEDEDITLHTTAIDVETASQHAKPEGTKIQGDKIAYWNLIPGRTYDVETKLVDQATGEPVLDPNGDPIIVRTQKTAEDKDGEWFVEVEVDASLLKGKTTVFFEYLYFDNLLVAFQAELNDIDESIGYPDIKTKAWDKKDGDKTINCGKKETVVDTMYHEGLIPGYKYKERAEIYNKTKKITVTTVESDFVATGSVASTDIDIPLDATDFANDELVVFRTVFDRDGKIVAEHKDENDQDQTINVSPPGNITGRPPRNGIWGSPRTGDETHMLHLIILLLISTIVLSSIGIYFLQKEKNEKTE